MVFRFTKAAEETGSEEVMIIRSTEVTRKYSETRELHGNHSESRLSEKSPASLNQRERVDILE